MAIAVADTYDTATIARRWLTDYRAATPATDMLYAAGLDDPAWNAALEELAVSMGQSAPLDVFAAPAPSSRPSALGHRPAPRRGSALDPNRRG